MPDEHPPAKRRASRGKVRAWAWILGTFSFLAPGTILGLSPKPPADASPTPARAPKQPPTPQRPVVMVITKKVIVTSPAAPSVPARTTSGSAPIHYVYAPAPASAPVTVSCGTHAC
jgi:hypothetical protein